MTDRVGNWDLEKLSVNMSKSQNGPVARGLIKVYQTHFHMFLVVFVSPLVRPKGLTKHVPIKVYSGEITQLLKRMNPSQESHSNFSHQPFSLNVSNSHL